MASRCNRFFQIALIVIATVLAAACATAPVSTSARPLSRAGAFALEGRVSIVTDDTTLPGKIEWRHDVDRDHIVLSSPLGQRVGLVDRAGSRYRVVTPEKTIDGVDNLNQLLDDAFGWTLPIDQMPDWAVGAPMADQPSTQPLIGGRTTPDGWSLRYDAWTTLDGVALPTKMRFSNDQIAVRLIVDHWRRLP